jgi:hypothetical protein
LGHAHGFASPVNIGVDGAGKPCHRGALQALGDGMHRLEITI